MQRAGCAISAVDSVMHLEAQFIGTWHAGVTVHQWMCIAGTSGVLWLQHFGLYFCTVLSAALVSSDVGMTKIAMVCQKCHACHGFMYN
jgi:hypothetical protein